MVTSPLQTALLLDQPMAVQTIPIHMLAGPTSVVGGNGSITCTIEIDPDYTAGGSVQVSCDNQSILTSPSGQWPYNLAFAPGVTSASFTIGTSAVAADTIVRIYTCEEGKDITNPLNWRAVTSVTVQYSAL